MSFELAAASARSLHHGEGKAKEEKDRMFKELCKKKGKSAVPDKWTDSEAEKGVHSVDLYGSLPVIEFESWYAEIKLSLGQVVFNSASKPPKAPASDCCFTMNSSSSSCRAEKLRV